MTSDYICFDCGNQYLTEAQKKEERVHTCHEGVCGICNKKDTITHIRAFNYCRTKQQLKS